MRQILPRITPLSVSNNLTTDIRRDALEERVLSGLRGRLMEPGLYKIFEETFYRELNRVRSDETAKLSGARRELEKVERRIRKIVELITEDDAPSRALKKEL